MAYTEANLNYYRKNPSHITADLDTDLLLKLIDIDAESIKYVKPQSPDLIYAAYDIDPSVFKYIDFSKVSIQFLEMAVDENPIMVQHIYYPSPEVMKIALNRDINVLPYIEKYLDDTMYEWLLTRNGLTLEFIPAGKQTESLVLSALDENPESYQYAHVKTETTDNRLIDLDPTKVTWVSKYWPSLIEPLVIYNPRFITKFFDQPEIVTNDIKKLALDGEANVFRTFENPDLEIKKYAVDKDVHMLAHIPYNQDVIDYAIMTNGLALQYVKKKDLKTIKDAITQNVHALEFVEYPRQFLIDYAFARDGAGLRFLVDPTYEECLDAVRRNPFAIEYVPDTLMSKDLQLYALLGGVKIIPLIKEPYDDEVLIQMITIEPSYIFKVDEPSILMYVTAFAIEGTLILFVPNWNNVLGIEIISAALSSDGSILKFVENKTKTYAMVAIENYPSAIQWMSYQDTEMAHAAVAGDPRTLFFINQDAMDEELLDLAVELDPEFFTRTEGEMTWEEWIELTGL